jgi:hypothetical protein
VVKAVGLMEKEECLVIGDKDTEGREKVKNQEGKEGQKNTRKKVKVSKKEEDGEGDNKSGRNTKERGEKEDEEKRVSIHCLHSYTHTHHYMS